jgi:hypothetical protein
LPVLQPDELERLVRFTKNKRILKKKSRAESLYAAHGVEGVDSAEAVWVSISGLCSI